MRIAVIGAGRMGAYRARLLAAQSAVTEVMITDLAPDRAQAAKGSGIVAVPDVDELFARRPDAVVVATATAAHARLVRRCVDASLPCFCEKPLALELDETRALRGLVRAQEALVQVGFQRRFDEGLNRVRDAVVEGSLGEVRRLHLISADAEPPPADFLPGSGGIFKDLSIHDFDLVRWITGREIVSVHAVGSAVGAPEMARLGDVHNAVCVLELAGGVVASVHASRDNGAGHDVRLEVAGTRATVTAGLSARAPLWSAEEAGGGLGLGTAPPWPGFLDRFDAAYTREMGAFVSFASGRTANPSAVDDAFEALCAAVAAQRSLLTGGPVRIDEIRNLADVRG